MSLLTTCWRISNRWSCAITFAHRQTTVALLLQLRPVFVCQWCLSVLNHLRSNSYACVLFLAHHRSSRRQSIDPAPSQYLQCFSQWCRTYLTPRYVRRACLVDQLRQHPAWAADWLRNQSVYGYRLRMVSFSVQCRLSTTLVEFCVLTCYRHRRWSDVSSTEFCLFVDN